jgi:O-antigen ligase
MITSLNYSRENLLCGLLTITICAIPFSILICHMALLATFAFIISERRFHEKLSIIQKSIVLQIFIGYMLLQVAGLVFSDDLEAGVWVLEKKIFLFLTPLILGTSLVRLSTRSIRVILYSFCATCLACTFWCVYYAFTNHNTELTYLPAEFSHQSGKAWMFFSYIGLSKGIGIHPTFFSLFIAFCICWLYGETRTAQTGARRVLLFTVIAYLAIILAMLSARIVIASMLALGVATMAYELWCRNFSRAVPAISLLIIICVVVVINPVTRYRTIGEFELTSFSIDKKHHFEKSSEIRLSLWWMSVQAMKDANPFTGYGTGGAVTSIERVASANGITNVLDTHDPHNQYFYSYLSNGLPGLLVLTGGLFTLLILFIRLKSFLPATLLFLYLMTSLTESVLELQKGIIFFSCFVSLLSFHAHSLDKITWADKKIAYAAD